MLASLFTCSPCCTDNSTEQVVVVAHSSESKPRRSKSKCVEKAPVVPAAVWGTEPSWADQEYREYCRLLASTDFFEFDVTVDKSGDQKLGLEISAYDGRTLLVGKVKDVESPVSRWNAEQSTAELRIYRGDRIMAVNDVSGDSDAILEAQRADVLAMKVRRLLEFTVTIELPEGGESLGLDFEDVGGAVAVSALQKPPGLAQLENKRNAADIEIRTGDVVVQVNREAAKDVDSIRLLASLPGFLELRLRRPPPGSQELILTVYISPDDDGEFADVSCITMAGDEVCSVRVSLGDAVRVLRAAISAEMPGRAFQMILPSGQAVLPRNDAVLLSDLVVAV